MRIYLLTLGLGIPALTILHWVLSKEKSSKTSAAATGQKKEKEDKEMGKTLYDCLQCGLPAELVGMLMIEENEYGLGPRTVVMWEFACISLRHRYTVTDSQPHNQDDPTTPQKKGGEG